MFVVQSGQARVETDRRAKDAAPREPEQAPRRSTFAVAQEDQPFEQKHDSRRMVLIQPPAASPAPRPGTRRREVVADEPRPEPVIAPAPRQEPAPEQVDRGPMTLTIEEPDASGDIIRGGGAAASFGKFENSERIDVGEADLSATVERTGGNARPIRSEPAAVTEPAPARPEEPVRAAAPSASNVVSIDSAMPHIAPAAGPAPVIIEPAQPRVVPEPAPIQMQPAAVAEPLPAPAPAAPVPRPVPKTVEVQPQPVVEAAVPQVAEVVPQPVAEAAPQQVVAEAVPQTVVAPAPAGPVVVQAQAGSAQFSVAQPQAEPIPADSMYVQAPPAMVAPEPQPQVQTPPAMQIQQGAQAAQVVQPVQAVQPAPAPAPEAQPAPQRQDGGSLHIVKPEAAPEKRVRDEEEDAPIVSEFLKSFPSARAD